MDMTKREYAKKLLSEGEDRRTANAIVRAKYGAGVTQAAISELIAEL